MSEPLWRLVDVTVPGRHGPRLDRVTVNIPPGVTAILGPSGAGKSTLLNLLVGFEVAQSGTVTRGQQSSVNRLPAYWSPPGHGLWPHLNVAAHVTSLCYGADSHSPAEADQILDALDLMSLRQVYPATLSQGERDRLTLARALASGAEVLVLDEPLIHVQKHQARQYWEFLLRWCQSRGTSIVIATHESQLFVHEDNIVIWLDQGRISSAGRADGSL